MQLQCPAKAGDHMCLVKAYGSPNWAHECTTTYEGCMNRAKSIMAEGNTRSIMVVAVLVTARPSDEAVWESALGNKITEG